MSEGQDIRASHEEVEAFVGKLRGFYAELDPAGQAMLGTILEGAQSVETGGYGKRTPRYEGPEPWQDLIGWIEGQGGEDTQGFGYRGP